MYERDLVNYDVGMFIIVKGCSEGERSLVSVGKRSPYGSGGSVFVSLHGLLSRRKADSIRNKRTLKDKQSRAVGSSRSSARQGES